VSDFTDDHDPYTLRHLAALGIVEGAACLDVGAGGGSVARWMLELVGARGRVVAADIDEGPLREGLRGTAAEVRVLDVTGDGLPEAAFDLVHSRLMLCNLLDPGAVLQRLVAAARPGGTVVLADLDFTTHQPTFPAAAWNRAWPAFLHGLDRAGWDPAFGARLPAMLDDAGLEQVQAETLRRRVRGGSRTCRMTTRALERAVHVVDDLTAEDVDELRGPLSDPERAFVAPEFTIAWGLRPRRAA
jgi:2-polyprenyl-3-methyl-5-hydroxy-6-metoxy-1,4-benzoquinol methylase